MTAALLRRRATDKPVPTRIGALVVKDTFTGVSGTAMPSHTGETGATWARTVSGFTRDPAISDSNRARGSTAGGFAASDASGIPAGDECDITYDLIVKGLQTSAPKSWCSVFFRHDTAANSYYKVALFAASTTTIQVQLSKTVAGSFTDIVDQTFTAAVGDTIAVSISCRNAAKSVSINGVQKVTTSDNVITGATARKVGIGFDTSQTDSTGLHIDNFIVRDALPASATPVAPIKVRKIYFAYPGAPMDVATVQAAGVDVIVMNAWDVTAMRTLKAAIPKLQALVYKDLAGVKSTYDTSYQGIPLYATPMSQAQATSDLASSRLFSSGTWAALTLFPDTKLMDPADTAWQSAAATAVLAECAAYGWDGVMWDDTNPTLNATPGRPDSYPTDAGYATAVGSFLAAVYSRFQAAGKVMMANVGKWQTNAGTCDPWTRYLDCAMQENFGSYYLAGVVTKQPGADMKSMAQSAAVHIARGGTYVGLQYGQTQDAMSYALATLLVSARGGQVAMCSAGTDLNHLPQWPPEADYTLGYPLAAAVESPTRVFVREFSTGCIAVNLTNGTVTIPLPGGATWSSPAASLSGVTSVSAPTLTGYVFTRD